MQPAQETLAETYECRTEGRKKSLMHAFVSDFEDSIDVKCVIRDISKSGCRIATSYVDDLPRVVQIIPEGFDKPMIGKIIWRNSKFAGIQFVSAAEADALKSTRPEPDAPAQPVGFLSRLFSFSALRRRSGLAQRGDDRGDSALPSYGARALNAVMRPIESLKHLLGLLMGDAIRPIPKRAKSVIKAAHANERSSARRCVRRISKRAASRAS